MNQVFVFNKSYQDRLNEFNNVLGVSKLCSVLDVIKEWALYLELTMEPNGWQAIWKIPRLRCEEFNIEYPTLVLVYVNSVNFMELKAFVTILDLQNNIELPVSKCVVPLIELSITKEQDKTVCLNLEATSNSLDMVTFFFTHIMMPWDYDDDDTIDWLGEHLEPRLRLIYNINNCMISKDKIVRLEELFRKARRLQNYRSKLESVIGEEENTETVEKLIDIHVSLVVIRGEVELLANPLYSVESVVEFNEPSDTNISNWIVFHRQDTIDDQLALLNLIQNIIDSNAIINPVSRVTEAISSVKQGERIVFNKGVHEIANAVRLPHGVCMKGFLPVNETVLLAKTDDALFNCYDRLVLEDLTLDINTAQCGILIHSGSVLLRNCRIVGDGKTSTHRGFIVLGDSKLELVNCDISGFYTAIFGYTTSSIVLKNCTITNVTHGLKLIGKCNVNAECVSFANCKAFGIFVETDELLNEGEFQQGDFSLLKMFPDINLENVKSEGNGRDDVIIMHKRKLKPIADLFSNPNLDPTIIPNDSHDELNMNISVL